MNASVEQGAPLVFGLHDANRVVFGRGYRKADRIFGTINRLLEDKYGVVFELVDF